VKILIFRMVACLLLLSQRTARLAWACERRRWRLHTWQHILFSDESRFSLRLCDGRYRVYRRSLEMVILDTLKWSTTAWWVIPAWTIPTARSRSFCRSSMVGPILKQRLRTARLTWTRARRRWRLHTWQHITAT
jgi:hypothetical protein